MKKGCLQAIAKMTEKAIKKADNTNCAGWSYQPVAPKKKANK